jgi:hypothetical protein
MGGRLLASIGFVVSLGMIFTMAGKVDYMSLQSARLTPTVSSNAKASMNTTYKAIELSGPDQMGPCRTRALALAYVAFAGKDLEVRE